MFCPKDVGKRRNGTQKREYLTAKLFQNNKATCHPERSRSFSEREARKNRGANATTGSLDEFGWLAEANVTLLQKPPRFVARSRKPLCVLRFYLVLHSVKVRLRSG